MKKTTRHVIHKLIIWYLGKCAGAFHSGPFNDYGKEGKGGQYVVAMNDDTYHHFTVLADNRKKDEFHKMVWLLRDNDVYVP